MTDDIMAEMLLFASAIPHPLYAELHVYPLDCDDVAGEGILALNFLPGIVSRLGERVIK